MDATSAGSTLLPSNRKLAGLFCIVLTLTAASLYFKSSQTWRVAGLGALLFAVVGLAAPSLLAPLNRLWFRLGLLLGRITSPLVLGLLFFLLITPIALLARLYGRDALRLKK